MPLYFVIKANTFQLHRAMTMLKIAHILHAAYVKHVLRTPSSSPFRPICRARIHSIFPFYIHFSINHIDDRNSRMIRCNGIKHSLKHQKHHFDSFFSSFSSFSIIVFVRRKQKILLLLLSQHLGFRFYVWKNRVEKSVDFDFYCISLISVEHLVDV